MKIDTSAEDTIVRDFKHIYGSTEVTGDITFNIRGEEIRAHKAILADQSAELFSLIQQYDINRDPKKASALTLEDKYFRISHKAFDAMLRYFYYSEQNIDMLHGCELYPFVRDFKLQKLSQLLESIIGKQNVGLVTCLPVLDVAYNPLMNDNGSLQTKLKQEGLDFAVFNLEKVDFKPLESMSPVISSHILQRLQQTVGSKWTSSFGGGVTSPSKSTIKRDTADDDDDEASGKSKREGGKDRKESRKGKKEGTKRDDEKDEKKEEKDEKKDDSSKKRTREEKKEPKKTDKKEDKEGGGESVAAEVEEAKS